MRRRTNFPHGRRELRRFRHSQAPILPQRPAIVMVTHDPKLLPTVDRAYRLEAGKLVRLSLPQRAHTWAARDDEALTPSA